MLNFPKTGSTFARSIVKKAYKTQCPPLKKLAIRLGLSQPLVQDLLIYNPRAHIADQHGTVRDIPAMYRSKRKVSIIRNPINRYLSQYAFKWWQKHPPAPLAEILAVYPHFPELSFTEFYQMNQRWAVPARLNGLGLPHYDVGLQTLQFIEFFFEDPRTAVIQLLEEDVSSIASELSEISFLKQESLNTELKAFLVAHTPFDEHQLAFIENKRPLNTSEAKPDKRVAIDDDVKQAIYRRDKLLFTLFPEYMNG